MISIFYTRAKTLCAYLADSVKLQNRRIYLKKFQMQLEVIAYFKLETQIHRRQKIITRKISTIFFIKDYSFISDSEIESN